MGLAYSWRTVEERQDGKSRRVKLTFQGVDTDLVKQEGSTVHGKPSGMAQDDYDSLCRDEIQERLQLFGPAVMLRHCVKGHRLDEQRDDANEAIDAWQGKPRKNNDVQKLSSVMSRVFTAQETPLADRSQEQKQLLIEYKQAEGQGDIMPFAKAQWQDQTVTQRPVPKGLVYRAVQLQGQENLPLPPWVTAVINKAGQIVEEGPQFASAFVKDDGGKVMIKQEQQ